MRPVRLELEGFTAFRDAVEVDFDGAELFALVGPTGAGKSSLIDAMVFALYGSVPRLDQRTVEPVIAAGRQEARVRLDFTVGDALYTAVRVVRRQPRGGATTKEARLESGEEVLAGDARGVTEAAEQVLGLGFQQFTKCVVLPQGEFARFLHDKPRDRQDLLVRLLELGVFERMRHAAHALHEAASQQVGWIDRQLEGLAGATPAALEAADRRVADLEALRGELDAAQPRLDELAAATQEALKAKAAADEQAERLAAIAVPDEVAALADAADAAAGAAAEAESAREQAEEAVRASEQALGNLPDRSSLEKLAILHEEAAQHAQRRERGLPIVAQARKDAEQAETARAKAEQALAGAEAALDAARRAHAAHDLAEHIAPGEPCPVCAQTVEQLPERRSPPVLRDAETALDRARATLQERTTAAQAARDHRARAEQTLADVKTALAGLRELLDGQPAVANVAERLAAVGKAEADLSAARERERTTRAQARAAAEQAQKAARRRDGAWQAFDAARDRVAALGSPPVDRNDLAGSWRALTAWAHDEAARQREGATAAAATAGESEAERATLVAKLRQSCEQHGVAATGATRPRDACVEALTAAAAERDQVAKDIEHAARLRAERTDRAAEAAVAGTLAGHLSAHRFERWLLDEALAALCDGANRTLGELSSGQYSLEIDDQRNFAVVDHRNADERRPARTLSGGETFLASLALALALAGQLRDLAVGATPRLESIFLDEGFGTLDPETLDVVAATVEELGASGRTVGLVTHVRELADRMPVRFEIRRSPSGSLIERVEV